MLIHTVQPSAYHYTFAHHATALRVADGDRVRFICPDADNTFADGSTIPPAQRDLGDPPSPIAGNPMVGPVELVGCLAGETLAVTIESITLDSTTGRTLLAPAHGYLQASDLAAPAPRVMHHWQLDHATGVAELVNPSGDDRIRVPLRPMVGCLGVCPMQGQAISTLRAGDHGGNLDLNLVRAGCTVLLPVAVDGGLFMLGDLHAAQGHGEIIGGGIETSGEVEVTLRRAAALTIQSPVLLMEGAIHAVATRDTADQAIRSAYAALLSLLVDALKLNRWDAYELISQAGRIDLGGFGVTYTVAAGLPTADLPPRAAAIVKDVWLRGTTMH